MGVSSLRGFSASHGPLLLCVLARAWHIVRVEAEAGIGRVQSLHVHGETRGAPMRAVEALTLVEGKGIVEDKRYFARTNRFGGASRRQVSLIEREQIDEHAATLGMQAIPPGRVLSNIETRGINLQQFVGYEVAIGEAVVFFYDPRTPCSKMDAICQGLRALMENGRQGVMAEVIRSGTVRVGDEIRPLNVRIKKGAGISAV
jgi:MOSC domain-containing protein YiiM